MSLLKEKKEKAQPTKIKTSGSTFKNPIDQTDKKVWQLIKESVPLRKIIWRCINFRKTL